MARKRSTNPSKPKKKIAAARNLCVPAVNNAGTWGRWAFVEIADPWDAANALRAFLTPPGDAPP